MTVAWHVAAQSGGGAGGFIEWATPLGVSVLVIVLVVAALAGVDRLLKRGAGRDAMTRVPRHVMMLALTVVGVVIVVLTLPVEQETRGQLLTLIGLAITAALTISSTTFVSNMMAGLMLRAVNSFRPGDYIEVAERFGRVTERGLFHIEIQTEDRDLCTLPNLHVATNPVKVVSSSGTVVSATVSLGYDAHHARVEGLLIEAAEASGLRDGFVQALELGDYSVTYRVAGFLDEVKHLLTARSNLRRSVLDALHAGGVEIVSPAFTYQRRVDPEKPVIPAASHAAKPVSGGASAPESMIFEKAEEAEAVEALREERDATREEIERIKEEVKGSKGDEAAKARLTGELERAEKAMERLEERIAGVEEEKGK